MSKSTNSNKAANTPQKKKKKSPKRNYRQIAISVLVVLALIAFILPDMLPLFTGGSVRGIPTPVTAPNSGDNPSSTMPEPTFTKEGTLSIISSETGTTIKQIDIEKAENDQERAIGMMFRKTMPDSQGMLFLFDESKPQSFWMKNTFIPLDIIFIDENKKITTIHPNASPQSETSLPSNGNAQYVLEVRGGFCQDYGVKVGDCLNWE